MASTMKELIKVSKLTKFGFQVNDEYVNFSKQLPEADKTRVVPGAEFDAELYVADSGKRYLNKILSSIPSASSPSAVPTGVVAPDAERAKKFTPKFQKKEEGTSGANSAGMSKEEWASKDRRISRQGCIQAAVQALAPVLSPDDLFKAASALSDQMLDYVNKLK